MEEIKWLFVLFIPQVLSTSPEFLLHHIERNTFQCAINSCADLPYSEIKINELFKSNPILKLNTQGILAHHRYGSTRYKVMTDDNYTIALFRLHEKNNKEAKSCQGGSGPMLFVHGLTANSDCWFGNTAGNNLPEYFCDKGFDVFVLSVRGTKYSKEHKYLNYKDFNSPYWDFSWHELGIYDVAASIDKMLLVTGFEQINYIGHSQGTTVILVLMITRPEYQRKIRAVSLMGPAAYMTQLGGDGATAIYVLGATNPIGPVSDHLHFMFPDPLATNPTRVIVPAICMAGSVNRAICSTVGFASFSFDICGTNCSSIEWIVATSLDQSPLKSLNHYMQGRATNRFAHYDNRLLGPIKSTHLGDEKTKDYDLKKVKVPLSILYGKNDYFTWPKDTEKMFREINGENDNVNQLVFYAKENGYPDFYHNSFITHRRIRELVGRKLKKFFRSPFIRGEMNSKFVS